MLIRPSTTTCAGLANANWQPRFFLSQWKRLVIYPRTDIERHFAWMKRYFGLKYFQCFTLLRVTQFVLLTTALLWRSL